MERYVTETAEHRLKRLTMRSWRRGTKEMDLILGPFADARLASMQEGDLKLYDQLLEENDQDLAAYVMGQAEPPAAIAGLLQTIAAFARQRIADQN
jgi:antitoxin CptB